MADSDNIPPPDNPDGKSKPPPGDTPAVIMPSRIPLADQVRWLKERVSQQGLRCSPDDVAIVVSPDVAAELYTRAWQINEVGHRAYEWDPRRLPYSWYMLTDVVGEVLGFVVLVRGLQDRGCASMVPFHALDAWQSQAEAVAEGKRCRSR